MTTEEITQLLLKSGRAGYVQNQGASIWVDDAAEVIANELERRRKAGGMKKIQHYIIDNENDVFDRHGVNGYEL